MGQVTAGPTAADSMVAGAVLQDRYVLVEPRPSTADNPGNGIDRWHATDRRFERPVVVALLPSAPETAAPADTAAIIDAPVPAIAADRLASVAGARVLDGGMHDGRAYVVLESDVPRLPPPASVRAAGSTPGDVATIRVLPDPTLPMPLPVAPAYAAAPWQGTWQPSWAPPAPANWHQPMPVNWQPPMPTTPAVASRRSPGARLALILGLVVLVGAAFFGGFAGVEAWQTRRGGPDPAPLPPAGTVVATSTSTWTTSTSTSTSSSTTSTTSTTAPTTTTRPTTTSTNRGTSTTKPTAKPVPTTVPTTLLPRRTPRND